MTSVPPNFRTKSGIAHVTAEAVTIERSGLRGATAKALQGNSTARTWLVYAVLCAALSYNGWRVWQTSTWPLAFVLWALVAWIVLFMLNARNFTMTPVVPRETATRVQAVKGIWGLTRDRVIIHFSENGKPVRRYVLMPGVLQDGANELERAVVVLEEAGWPVDKRD